MSVRRTLPKGRLERVVKLARMGAETGLGMVTGRNTEKLAEQATTVLSSMRGLAAKVGQMASTVEGVLPESMERQFSSALARLRDHTETSPFPEVAEVIETELGSKLSELFQSFEPTPIASASIGQVHRATLADGRIVAVKVQHPGIESAMESDLLNARLIERLAGTLVPSGFGADRVFDEVSARLREELDYRIEAAHQQRFARVHQRTANAIIPAVITSHSARRVITTELVQGRTLEEALLEASASDRAGYATTLWKFVFRSVLVAGEFNADPHPGNFLFIEVPKVAFLDFGCVQRLPRDKHQQLRAVHQAAALRDETSFAKAVRDLLQTRSGPFESLMIALVRQGFEPLFASPFRITRNYLRGLFNYAQRSKLEFLRHSAQSTPFPPQLAMNNRLQFGFYSLLARLDVELDYAALQRQILLEN
ncbi:MAG TPA: AarF/ABC1/UbiB kinase family protein [Polyangiaceae bacterium]|nr:AarF/ABC1/UbiB kinase family protein [Polyangiaceae bacterium]